MKGSKLFTEFFNSEKAGGAVLILCTLLSLFLANSSIGQLYNNIWHVSIADYSLTHWINDGLMTIFFLLIGLELERELYHGELSNVKDAMLPVAGALGGMLVPAVFYLFFNYGLSTQNGAGIPMATDIAFALGILSLAGEKVPPALKIFLTALAVIDDLGAILMIAVFYSKGIAWIYLFAALTVMGILFIFNRFKVYHLALYLIGGVIMWYCMMHSGIHATITGVLLAFVIPFGDGSEKSPSYKLQHYLHKPVAFAILPLFALANTAIVINSNWQQIVEQPYSKGIAAGLIAGKPIGIFTMTYIAVKAGFCKLPAAITWRQVLGAGLLGGIGFTMSVFITLLAFDNAEVVNHSKLIILLSSLISGLTGYILLSQTWKKQ